MKKYIVSTLFPSGWEGLSFDSLKLALKEYKTRVALRPTHHHTLEYKEVLKSNYK